MKKDSRRINQRLGRLHFVLVAVLLMAIIVLSGCSSSGTSANGTDLSEYPASDMSGYAGLKGYDKELVFVDVTMDDVDAMMKNKDTFVLYAGFSNCPWCNALISHLNDVALESNVKIAYLDTRRDPSWKNNMEIDGYDIFKEYFGEYLDIDEDGEPHLYVPDTYFIKKGEVVHRHEGVTPSLGGPSDEWTQDMIEEVETALKEGFDKLK